MPTLFTVIIAVLISTFSVGEALAREKRFHILGGLQREYGSFPSLQIGISRPIGSEIIGTHFFVEYFFMQEYFPLSLNASGTVRLWQGESFISYLSGGVGFRTFFPSIFYGVGGVNWHVGTDLLYRLDDNVFIDLNFRQYFIRNADVHGRRGSTVEKTYYTVGLGIAVDIPQSRRKR